MEGEQRCYFSKETNILNANCQSVIGNRLFINGLLGSLYSRQTKRRGDQGKEKESEREGERGRERKKERESKRV